MKKLYVFLIIIGLICAAGIIYISAVSENINENLKSIGFIITGYIGVISFTYGWVKLYSEMKNQKKLVIKENSTEKE
jgi:predicted membrane channel-forming protein YqfA (hemolysin III family)